MPEEKKQIFLSHTKKDKEFCDLFDTIFARVDIRGFRSEFEDFEKPAWKTIMKAINDSTALFLLIGKELVQNHAQKVDGWNHTQNWIAYEIGVACQKGIDVWAICDNVKINFPMPYVNNYLDMNLRTDDGRKSMRKLLEAYCAGQNFSFPYTYPLGRNASFRCNPCGMLFNVHHIWTIGDEIRCPQCLTDLIAFKNDPVTFRRKREDYSWHWRKDCADWPKTDYEEIPIKGLPEPGIFCEQCQMKDRIQQNELMYLKTE